MYKFTNVHLYKYTNIQTNQCTIVQFGQLVVKLQVAQNEKVQLKIHQNKGVPAPSTSPLPSSLIPFI